MSDLFATLDVPAVKGVVGRRTAGEMPAEVLDLPHLAILGGSGSGKTTVAKLIHQMLCAPKPGGGMLRRSVVIDPTGAWWGVRMSADGKGPGFDVMVLGGLHGDAPLEPNTGTELGRLIATSKFSAVLDLSLMEVPDQRRFVRAFADAIYQHNKGVLHVIIDEADEFAPQHVEGAIAPLVGAIKRLLQRGRIKGLRCLLISQRAAVLNKTVLGQVTGMFAMKVMMPLDRKAVKEWFSGTLEKDDVQRLYDTLPTLSPGEGFAWLPNLGGLMRRQFPRPVTYDSSATPEDETEIHVTELTASEAMAEILVLMKTAIGAGGEEVTHDELTAADIEEARQAAYAKGYAAGVEAERARLGPLLDDNTLVLDAILGSARRALEATEAAKAPRQVAELPPPAKQRRRRRTKAEMAAASALEAEPVSRHRRAAGAEEARA